MFINRGLKKLQRESLLSELAKNGLFPKDEFLNRGKV
jgi:hypothetical protein